MAFGKKETNYFELLSNMAQCTRRAAVALQQMLQDYTNVAAKADAVHDIEHEGDGLLHHLVKELNRAFITPIDREDILTIADGIDTITDTIEDVANLFDMLSIQTVYPEALDMVACICRCCDKLADAVQEFARYKHSKTLGGLIVEVNRLEEEGDRMHRSVIKALYQSTTLSVLDIAKYKEVYDTMERVFDACEDVADMLEGLIVKNS